MAAGLLVIGMEPVASAFVAIWKHLVAAMGMAVGAMSQNGVTNRGYAPHNFRSRSLRLPVQTVRTYVVTYLSDIVCTSRFATKTQRKQKENKKTIRSHLVSQKLSMAWLDSKLFSLRDSRQSEHKSLNKTICLSFGLELISTISNPKAENRALSVIIRVQ